MSKDNTDLPLAKDTGASGARPVGGNYVGGGSASTGIALKSPGESELSPDRNRNAANTGTPTSPEEGSVQIPIQQGNIMSLQHLEAPINNMVMKFLDENAELAATFFRVTGLTPTRAADWLIQRFHGLGRKPTSEEVSDVILDAIDSSSEVAAIQKPSEHFTAEGAGLVTEWDNPDFSNLRVAVATLRSAANVLPGGIHDLIVLRAALSMRPEAFASATRVSYGFDPNVWFGDRIQDLSEQVRVF